MSDEKAPLYVVTMGISVAITAALSPFLVVVSRDLHGEVCIWLYTIMMYYNNCMSMEHALQFHEPWMIIQYLPIVSFRLLFVYQLVRYYQGKTVAERTILAAVIGEVPPLLLALAMAPGVSLFRFVGPLPFHLLVGLLFVAIKRPYRPSALWAET